MTHLMNAAYTHLRFGHAFLFDSASSVGEISGHSKIINSVSMRQVGVFPATL